MKQGVTLTIASLLSILLMTLHLADDFVRQGGTRPLEFSAAVLIAVVWLYGTLVLAGRRSGYVIIALGSFLALSIPVVHIRESGGTYFFVWTLLALSITSLFSLIVSVAGFWSLRGPRIP
jgi:hypothetical protein